MKKTLKFLAAITACTLLLAIAPLALAGSLTTPVQNTWAPEGERIGLENHWALGFDALDSYGSASKTLEDWQMGEEYSGYGLFSYRRAIGTERFLGLRGYATNADGEDLTRRFSAELGCIGKRTLTVRHRAYNYFSDATTEQRHLTFAVGPAPEALDPVPTLAWCRSEADLRYHVTDRLDLAIGVTGSRRDGAKASLLRDGASATVPGLKTFDTEIMELRWGGALALGPVATDLRMSYRTAEGQRALDDRHATTDDQKLFTTRLGATYDIAPDTRVLGHLVSAKLENEGIEVVGGETYRPATQGTTNAGGLAVMRRVGTHALVRLSAAFKKQGTTADESIADADRLYRDRDRKSQDYTAAVRYHGLSRTRLEAQYRLRTTDLQEATTAFGSYESDLGGVTLAEAGDTYASEIEKTRQEIGLKVRHRLGRKAKLKARLEWTSEDVKQSVSWESDADQPWFLSLGDRKTSQLNWRLALHTRPAKNFSLDLGHQMLDRDFELEAQGTETSWKSQRGFAAAYWRADDIFTLYFNASLGRDQVELVDGPETGDSLSPIAYDGTTWRSAPGAVVQLTSKLQFEAQYEMVRFEDDGDDPAGLNRLSTDYDRTTVRARYRLLEKIGATASYRRYVFDENRWDDTINDIYTLSLSGTF